jgi:hypothetical protein
MGATALDFGSPRAGSQLVMPLLLSSDIRACLKGRSWHNAPRSAYFVTLALQKKESAVTGILLQGPNTSTGRGPGSSAKRRN